MIRVRVPGKVVLAGEYSVLAGGPALVAAVRRHLCCELEEAPRDRVEAPGVAWDGGAVPDGARFAVQALSTSRAYLEGTGLRLPPVALRLSDELRDAQGRKLGLGGSAATCAAVVGACLASQRALDRDVALRLAALAHSLAQSGKGSGVDVAASVLGGVLFLRRIESEVLAATLVAAPGELAGALSRLGRPEVTRTRPPPRLGLAATGMEAATPRLVEVVESFAGREPAAFADFLARNSEAADALRRALEASDDAAAVAAVGRAGTQLERLGTRSGAPVVLPEHRRIVAAARAAGGAAKPSGAGGGDCCVVLGPETAWERLRAAVGAASAGWLEPGVDEEGLCVEGTA